MQIGLTQKLQGFVKREISSIDVNSDPFFSWTAGLGYLDHRKYIFIVNDATRCGFVLCALKAKDINNLEQLIVDGIREMFDAEFIVPELGDQYFKECGEITYTKTVGRSEVARLNKFTDYAYYSLGRKSCNNKLNATVLRQVNHDFVSKGGGELQYTKDLLRNEFVKHYGTLNPVQSDVAIFNIKLELESECSRILAIPVRYSVYDFHVALQRLFQWKDYHLHKFCVYDQYEKNLIFECSEDDLEFETEKEEELERQMTIEELIEKAEKMTYYYDFGDGWETTIKLVRVDKDDSDILPKCIAAVGDAPPEDIGGPYGFAELQKIISNPDYEEYEETMEWLKNMRWKHLDMEDIQRMLQVCFK